MNKWIPGCPVQIKELSIVSSGEKLKLHIRAESCAERDISRYTADVKYYNERREVIKTDVGVELLLQSEIDIICTCAAYAEATIRSVTYTDGAVWKNVDCAEGITLPEQEIIWQTDPLYKVIKSVTQGKVNAKYFPDTVACGWRCACGGVNIEDSEHCGTCGCSHKWLKDNFDRDFLESQKSLVEEGKKPQTAERIKKREAEKRIPDSVKMVLIFASVALVVALALFLKFYAIPQKKYNDAIKLAEGELYNKAIDHLEDLGDYKDSKELIERYTYEFFVLQTGIHDLYITTTEAEPWFEISEDGVIKFISSKYTGTYEDFKIPHIVNGIVATELAKNFLINCDELEAIVIPDTIEVIGEQSFLGCKSLKYIKFGTRVHTIYQRAFIDCTALEEIGIPDSVTYFGQRLLNNCTSLKYVTLGRGITEIGAYTFSNCPELVEIVLRSPISKIGDYAFAGCTSLTQIRCAFYYHEWVMPEVGVGNEVFSEINIVTSE